MSPKPPIEEGAVDEEAVDEEEELVFGVTRFPRTPQPWQSLGSEVEVEDENVVENRPKVMFMGNRKETSSSFMYHTVHIITIFMFCDHLIIVVVIMCQQIQYPLVENIPSFQKFFLLLKVKNSSGPLDNQTNARQNERLLHWPKHSCLCTKTKLWKPLLWPAICMPSFIVQWPARIFHFSYCA